MPSWLRVDKKAALYGINLADFARNLERYAGTNWYVGAVFIGGELVP